MVIGAVGACALELALWHGCHTCHVCVEVVYDLVVVLCGCIYGVAHVAWDCGVALCHLCGKDVMGFDCLFRGRRPCGVGCLVMDCDLCGCE